MNLNNFNYNYHLGAKHPQFKVKFISSICQKLVENCMCVLQMVLEGKLDDCKDNQDSEQKKLHLLKLFEDRLLQILKCMIKLSITKLPT
jgi:hypothetical protein